MNEMTPEQKAVTEAIRASLEICRRQAAEAELLLLEQRLAVLVSDADVMLGTCSLPSRSTLFDK
jgi:hypothetical protein